MFPDPQISCGISRGNRDEASVAGQGGAACFCPDVPFENEEKDNVGVNT